jgi:hypothetical protein
MLCFAVEILRRRKPVLGNAQPRRPVPQNHSLLASLYGSGRSNSVLTILKIIVSALMPIASMSNATAVKPGDFANPGKP